MKSGFDVDQKKLVKSIAEEFKNKKILVPPSWAKFVKTSPAKDRPPEQQDWWFLRGASILRRMYIDRKPIGVSKLRRIYGDKSKNTYSSHHFKTASGAIIRKLLQQLEAASLIQKSNLKNHAGRMISSKGISFIDKISKGIQ